MTAWSTQRKWKYHEPLDEPAEMPVTPTQGKRGRKRKRQEVRFDMPPSPVGERDIRPHPHHAPKRTEAEADVKSEENPPVTSDPSHAGHEISEKDHDMLDPIDMEDDVPAMTPPRRSNRIRAKPHIFSPHTAFHAEAYVMVDERDEIALYVAEEPRTYKPST